jgi:hypothetical protein
MATASVGTARLLAENVCKPPPIADGHMAVSLGPGLGFDPQPWWDLRDLSGRPAPASP